MATDSSPVEKLARSVAAFANVFPHVLGIYNFIYIIWWGTRGRCKFHLLWPSFRFVCGQYTCLTPHMVESREQTVCCPRLEGLILTLTLAIIVQGFPNGSHDISAIFRKVVSLGLYGSAQALVLQCILHPTEMTSTNSLLTLTFSFNLCLRILHRNKTNRLYS